MDRERGWGIDVKSFSTEQLVKLHQELDASEHEDVQLDIRRELVTRIRRQGWSDAKIIDYFMSGVPKGEKRNQIAKGWAPALGISEKEFKRIASGK